MKLTSDVGDAAPKHRLVEWNGRLTSVLRRLLPADFSFVDVGAYVGDFAATLLEIFPRAAAFLFEPSEEGLEKLRQRFSGNPLVHIFDCALSDENGTREFYLTNHPATNSLIRPLSVTQRVKKISVKVATLDSVLKKIHPPPRVDLLKIDTQGNDLRVLKGSERAIQQYLPFVLIEVIFISLYEEQAGYYEIFDHMKALGYKLASIYEPHYSSQGQIAFADLLFLHGESYSKLQSPGYRDEDFVSADPTRLLNRNSILQTACDERLELINQLTKTSEERLHVIQLLDAEVRKLSQKG